MSNLLRGFKLAWNNRHNDGWLKIADQAEMLTANEQKTIYGAMKKIWDEPSFSDDIKKMI